MPGSGSYDCHTFLDFIVRSRHQEHLVGSGISILFLPIAVAALQGELQVCGIDHARIVMRIMMHAA